MGRFFKSKWFKIPFYTGTFAFAAVGFFLTVSYMAIQFRWTDDAGSIDSNSRYFEKIHAKYADQPTQDSLTTLNNRYQALDRIVLLKEYYPTNAQYILNALQNGTAETEVLLMLDAIDIQLKKNKSYQRKKSKILYKYIHYKKNANNLSAYEWMNISEWKDFKIAVAKDKHLIDSVEKITGVEGRVIVACLVAEQIRLFNSDREAYKKWIGPLKVLSVESKFSFGVTGIKEHTAKNIERYCKDASSEFYLGADCENLLAFKGTDTASINKERFDRLTNFRNHYYSYLYAALFLKQMKVQWEGAGYPIHDRPEILATLFNLGYINSRPKADPQVGGAEIKVHEVPYTFGALAFQFYYSGELIDLFPYRRQKFDWNREV